MINNITDEEDVVLPLEEIAKMVGQELTVPYESGFKTFDESLLGGYREGDLVSITGCTGEGKTTYAQTLTYNFAKNKIPSVWFSYEIAMNELWKKFVDMGVNTGFISYAPFKIFSGRLDWIKNKITEAKNKYGIKVVFVDHLGYLSPTPQSYDKHFTLNYSAYLTTICRELKLLALKEKIIIFLLTHQNKTDDPSMRNISGSAGISQESDVVMTVQREIDKNNESGECFKVGALIKMDKNRRTGITKKIQVRFSSGKLEEIFRSKEEAKKERDEQQKIKWGGFAD